MNEHCLYLAKLTLGIKGRKEGSLAFLLLKLASLKKASLCADTERVEDADGVNPFTFIIMADDAKSVTTISELNLIV